MIFGHTVSYCPIIEKLNQEKISSAFLEYKMLSSSIFSVNSKSELNFDGIKI